MATGRKRSLAFLSVGLGCFVGLALVGLSLASVGGTSARAAPYLSLPPEYLADPRALGPVDAPVRMLVYFDFQCGYCGDLHEDAELPLIERYVATGQLRLEARPLPMLGPESLRAAEAALCAADQGYFWQFRDAAFDAWYRSGPSVYTESNLRWLASEVGLDQAAFAACLTGGQQRPRLEKDLEQARNEQVRAVPTVLINGQAYQGRRPLDFYVQLIEQELGR